MRPLAQRFDDHRRHGDLGSDDDVRRQQPLDNQNAVLRNGLEARVLLAAKSPDDIAAQIQHVIGALAEGLVFQRLELLVPPLQYPAQRPLRRSTAKLEAHVRIRSTHSPRSISPCAERFPRAWNRTPLRCGCVLIELGQRFLDGMRRRTSSPSTAF